MFEVTLRETKTLIKMAIEEGLSLILMGSPGIGKTEILEQTSSEMGIGFLCFEASSLDPTDVRGVLIPDNGRSYFTKSPLLPIPEKHGKNGILLIDELPSGLPAVQVALHPLFHPKERRLGTDRLPEGWIPMATGNYASDGAGAHNLLTALSDRIGIVNVVENLDVWKEDYAFPKRIHPIVIGFLNFRPDLFSTFKKRVKEEKGKSFASPRAHTFVSKVLYYADREEMDENSLFASISAYVGVGVASEYIAFRKVYKELPDVMDIFKGKNIIPKEPSVLHALCASIVSSIGKQKDTKKAVDRMLEYSLLIEAEFGMLLIRDAFASYSKEIVKSNLWPKVSSRYKGLEK